MEGSWGGGGEVAVSYHRGVTGTSNFQYFCFLISIFWYISFKLNRPPHPTPYQKEKEEGREADTLLSKMMGQLYLVSVAADTPALKVEMLLSRSHIIEWPV